MMKINLVKEVILRDTNAFFCGVIYLIGVLFVVWGLHFVMYNVPPTVLTAVVVDVSANHIDNNQLIRGNYLFIRNYLISYDRENWAKRLPISCEELGANIVFVKGNDDIIVETMLLVQDYESRLCHDPYDEYILPWPRGE